MQIIEIKSLPNGAHNNQTLHGVLPEGWVKIPDDLAIPDTFPFVNITVDGDTVTSMVENLEAYEAMKAEVKARKTEEIKTKPTVQDDIDKMLIDQEYRITMLELGLNV